MVTPLDPERADTHPGNPTRSALGLGPDPTPTTAEAHEEAAQKEDPLLDLLKKVGSLLTAATLVGLIGDALGASKTQIAGISLYVVLCLCVVIYRRPIQRVLPVSAVLVTALTLGCWVWLFRDDRNPGNVGDSLTEVTGIVEYTPRANDFLPKLDRYINDARREIWFVGMSFYVTLPQHRELLMRKLADGIDVRFLIYDPYSPNIRDVAAGFSQTEEALRTESEITVQNLKEMLAASQAQGLRGRLEIRFFSSVPRSRLYIFDRRLESGYTYFIPHIDQQNTPNLPGFLARNVATGVAPAYWDGAERIWQGSMPFERWMVQHAATEAGM